MARKAEEVPYLDYLDKEMSIMGILSTFCVVIVGGVAAGLGSATSESLWAKHLWDKSWVLLLAGSSLLLVAGLFFYLQRSRLALLYGQICLCLETPQLAPYDWDVRDWLSEADSYSSWVFYKAAFLSMSLGFLEYFVAILEMQLTLFGTAAAQLAGSLALVFASNLVLCIVLGREMKIGWKDPTPSRRSAYQERYKENPPS